jgi:cytochrome c oxidase subunit 3
VTGGDPRHGRDGTIPGAGVLGMGIFLATLGVLFVAAVVGTLLVRFHAERWRPQGLAGATPGLAGATLVLLAASTAVQGALRRIRAGDAAGCARRLTATLGLGVAFVLVQAWNWRALWSAHVTASSSLYGFTFYLLTGLHAAHVAGGITLLAIVLARARRGRYGAGEHAGVTYAAMYWHFLDAVWLMLFAVVTLV